MNTQAPAGTPCTCGVRHEDAYRHANDCPVGKWYASERRMAQSDAQAFDALKRVLTSVWP